MVLREVTIIISLDMVVHLEALEAPDSADLRVALDLVDLVTTADLEEAQDLEDLKVALDLGDLVTMEAPAVLDLADLEEVQGSEDLKESPVVTMEAQEALAVPAVLYVLTSPEQMKTC